MAYMVIGTAEDERAYWERAGRLLGDSGDD